MIPTGETKFEYFEGTGGAHQTRLSVSGLPAGTYDVNVDGRIIATIRGTGDEQRVPLPCGPSAVARVSIVRQGAR